MNRFALPILIFGLHFSAQAQIEVGLEMKRNLFMRGEPIEASVTVRNLAGKDILLADEGQNRWFGFQITKDRDTPIGPHSGEYRNAPQRMLSGGSMKRSVDLLKLYPVNEYGSYIVQAAIYFQETGKYLTSAPLKLEISEGRKLWTQTVGVPAAKDGAGEYRVVSLLTFPHPKEIMLYVRVVGEKSGNVFGIYPLGRLLTGTTPAQEFDRDNTLHIFHMFGPSQYYLSKIGVNGEWMGQTVWQSARGRPFVRQRPDGKMVIVGATRSSEKPPPGPDVPRLSDRPVVLPK